MAAAAVMGFVIEAMRKMVSRSMGVAVARSWAPTAST